MRTIFATSAHICHPERSEGSLSHSTEILRCAQDDILAFWSSRLSPPSLLLALLLAIPFLLSPASAHAFSSTRASRFLPSASSITLQIDPGFNGRYRDGDWVPIHITLRNNGADFNGTLSTRNTLSPIVQSAGFTASPISRYQQAIKLPHGAQQEITIYLPLYTFFGTASIEVHLLDAHGKVIQSQSATLHALNQEDIFVGLLSDQTPGFGPLQALALPAQSGSVLVQFLNAQTLPDMAAALANFNLIVLDNFTTASLSHQQMIALATWVNQGGALVEIGGSHWRRTLNSLPTNLLPVSIYGTSTLPTGTRLLPVDGPAAEGSGPSSTALQAPIEVSAARVRADARMILSAGTVPLLVQAQRGQGSICYLAFDPTIEPIVGWPGAIALWKGLLLRSFGEQLLPSNTGPAPGVVTSYELAKLQHALLPYTSPAPWFLVPLFFGYLLILGPMRWLIVRRFKRRTWSWRIVLSVIVVFSLLNYALALYQQGTSTLSNSFSIIRLDTNDSFAHSTSYIGVYVPFMSADGSVQMHFPNHTLIQLFSEYVLQLEPATIAASSNGTDVNLPYADLRELNAFQVEQDLPVQGGITSHITLANGSLTGAVTNTLPTALSDVYVLMSHNIVRLGTLGAGQTSIVKLPLPASTTNASLPSCGSLVNHVKMSSGGLPAGYDQLFYHDINRALSERQNHVSFLTFLLDALQCNLSPLGAADSPATLIGWADQPLDAASTFTINGFHPAGLHETLLLSPLNITYSPVSLAQPADGLSGQLVDVKAVSIRRLSPLSYALMKGQMTFEYTIPPMDHMQQITFTQPADSSTQPYPPPGQSRRDPAYIALYNWQTHSWDAITLTASTSFSTNNLNAYLGPDGRVLLQCLNQLPDLGIISFTKPILTIT